MCIWEADMHADSGRPTMDSTCAIQSAFRGNAHQAATARQLRQPETVGSKERSMKGPPCPWTATDLVSRWLDLCHLAIIQDMPFAQFCL